MAAEADRYAARGVETLHTPGLRPGLKPESLLRSLHLRSKTKTLRDKSQPVSSRAGPGKFESRTQ